MTKNKELLYPKVNGMELDGQGGYYSRHVFAMTHEGLHSKSDIAKQLGARDLLIDQLEAKLAKVEDSFVYG